MFGKKKYKNPFQVVMQVPPVPTYQTHVPLMPAMGPPPSGVGWMAAPVSQQQPAPLGGPANDPYQVRGVQSVNPAKANRAGTQELFNNEVIFYCELNMSPTGGSIYGPLEVANQGFSHKISEMELRDQIKRFVYEPTVTEMEAYINGPRAIVPRDSGKLRNAMLLSIRGAAISPGSPTYTRLGNLHPFVLVLNTGNVDYAPFANEMDPSWLQHSGTAHATASGSGNMQRTHKGRMRSPRILNDPNAQTDFFGKTADAGRDRAQLAWDHFINHVLFPAFQNRLPYPLNATALDVALTLFTWRFN